MVIVVSGAYGKIPHELRGLCNEPVNLGIEKKTEQFSVNLFVSNAQFEDLEGAVGRDGSLVRTVGGAERIENVADGHHPGLHGNFDRFQTVWIALAVELFVMGARNFRNAAVFGGPGNLRQKIETVRDVRLDLPPFVSIQAATR